MWTLLLIFLIMVSLITLSVVTDDHANCSLILPFASHAHSRAEQHLCNRDGTWRKRRKTSRKLSWGMVSFAFSSVLPLQPRHLERTMEEREEEMS